MAEGAVSPAEEAFQRFVEEADEDVIRNEAYEKAARLGWNAAMDYRASLETYEYGAWYSDTANLHGVNVCVSLQEARDIIRSWGTGFLMRRVAESEAGPWEKWGNPDNARELNNDE